MLCSKTLCYMSSDEICNSFFNECTDEPKLPDLALTLTGGQSAPAEGGCGLGNVSNRKFLFMSLHILVSSHYRNLSFPEVFKIPGNNYIKTILQRSVVLQSILKVLKITII